MIKRIILFLACICMLQQPLCFADDKDKAEFSSRIELAPTDHIILDVNIPKGDVTISYRHAGEISIAATAHGTNDQDLPNDFFDRYLSVTRDGEHLKIQKSPRAGSDKDVRLAYTVNVPSYIEVNATVGSGKLSVSGVMGPVKLATGNGDINVNYVTTTLNAKTSAGNITVVRVGTSTKVETGKGNISLKDIGPDSVATVKNGSGWIAMDGVSGTFTASTDAGDLEAKGRVFDDWDLKSESGNIRIEIAAESKIALDVATRSGQLLIENDDIKHPKGNGVRASRQEVNGGGKLVHARSDRGNIVIK